MGRSPALHAIDLRARLHHSREDLKGVAPDPGASAAWDADAARVTSLTQSNCIHPIPDADTVHGRIEVADCYLLIIRLGAALGVCSAGEITNVTQAFQPSGRFWLANSQ